MWCRGTELRFKNAEFAVSFGLFKGYHMKVRKRVLRWNVLRMTSGIIPVSIKTVPWVKTSCARRSIYTCGKFAYHWICGGILCRETRRDLYSWIHMCVCLCVCNYPVKGYWGAATTYTTGKKQLCTLLSSVCNGIKVGIMNSVIVGIFVPWKMAKSLVTKLDFSGRLICHWTRSPEFMSVVNSRQSFTLVEHFSVGVYSS